MMVLLSNNPSIMTDDSLIPSPHVPQTISYAVEIPSGLAFEELDVDVLPDIETLYEVASFYLGKYALFFVALKMEESGADDKPSWLAVHHHNLVGMRYPKSRETYAIGSTPSNYAIYRNWFEAMLDFKIYMEIFDRSFERKKGKKMETPLQMLQYLHRSYNIYDKWYQDMLYLINYLERKFEVGNE
jgi:hypothetical protein